MQSSPAQAARVQSYFDELRPGAVLNGKYRIERQLSAGAMGAVHAARDVQHGTKLAIKVLLPELLQNAVALGRFEREARASARIANEHVVEILDVGHLESGAPYIVMEFLEGQDGAAYLASRGWLAIDEVIDIVLQACTAVSAAHALGIIHRDLKPSNLFFVPRPDGRPFVKVVDFGISKIIEMDGRESSHLTKSGSMCGSPVYASPEQWRDGKRVDQRSDIWSLGVVLFELLTGTLPFQGGSVALIGISVVRQDPRPLRELRNDVPADLAQIVLQCLEKKVDRRFQDVHALADALHACLRRHLEQGNRSVVQEGRPRSTALSATLSATTLSAVTLRWNVRALFSRWASALLAAIAWIAAFAQRRSAAIAPPSSRFDVSSEHPGPQVNG